MNKTARILFAAWLILAGSAGSPTPCLADAAVTLKPDAQIDRFAVKLSDLFVGVPAEIDRDVAQAPPACKPAIYNEVVLNKLAETYRLDWTPQGTSDHVMVSSACTRISGDMIRDAVAAKIKDTVGTKGRMYEITLDAHNLEADLPVDQKPDFTLENFSYDPAGKHFRADLSAQTPKGNFAVPITGRVAVKRSIPVLARHLEARTTVGADDLDWIQIPEERVADDTITDPAQLIGHELHRDTNSGEMLRAHDVVPPRLVQRGALVTLRIITPYITITGQGKAQQDGAVGETVRVVNTQSDRVVEGVVTGPDTVDIRTTQRVALAE